MDRVDRVDRTSNGAGLRLSTLGRTRWTGRTATRRCMTRGLLAHRSPTLIIAGSAASASSGRRTASHSPTTRPRITAVTSAPHRRAACFERGHLTLQQELHPRPRGLPGQWLPLVSSDLRARRRATAIIMVKNLPPSISANAELTGCRWLRPIIPAFRELRHEPYALPTDRHQQDNRIVRASSTEERQFDSSV